MKWLQFQARNATNLELFGTVELSEGNSAFGGASFDLPVIQNKKDEHLQIERMYSYRDSVFIDDIYSNWTILISCPEDEAVRKRPMGLSVVQPLSLQENETSELAQRWWKR